MMESVRPLTVTAVGLALLALGAAVGPASGSAQGRPTPLLERDVQAFAGDLPGVGALRPPTLQEGDGGHGTFLEIAKWSSLVLSLGASGYGFHRNAEADDEFERLEAICEADPDRCTDRNPDGTFGDARLERIFQSVLDKDRTARAVLILGQVGIATTVALFIWDLDDDGDTEDIPFRPPRLRVTDAGVELAFRIPLPNH